MSSCTHPVHAPDCECTSCFYQKLLPAKQLDQVSRLALMAVCAYIDRRQAVLYFCGGLLAGLTLGASYKWLNQPSPQLAELGNICGHGIIESASGRRLNPLLSRMAMVFFFWVCAHDHHHSGPYVKTASTASGYGLGLDIIDWLANNAPEQALSCPTDKHHKHQ